MSKSQLRWDSSPKSKGWDGMNNAAINVFNSHIINSFVREMFQNSNDARNDKLPIDKKSGKKPPLLIKINYKSFNRSEFPDFDGFLNIFKRIGAAKPNEGHEQFFKQGEKALADSETIKMFLYEDFNTIGLDGSDDDATKSFNSCVLSEGTTVKSSETAGGSYGIGKNAIFGFSRVRTVFYLSLNTSNEFIFQGIAKLASYKDSNGTTRESRIFCGDGQYLASLRDREQIPPPFRKVFVRTSPGLSQFAVCPSDDPNWVEEFTRAILRNYWLLLHNGDLEVELSHEDNLIVKMNEQTLDQLMLTYFDPKKFEDEGIKPVGNPFEFYKCYQEGECVVDEIPLLGRVKFYYRELENNETNRIAFVRNGMVVFSDTAYKFSSINYAGVFICENPEGNSLLRVMEPPTHDSFDPERITKSGKYSLADGKQVLRNIRNLIGASLDKIAEKYKQPAEDVPWLDSLLTSISGSEGKGSGSRKNEPAVEESPEKMGREVKLKLLFRSQTKDELIGSSGDESDDSNRNRGKKKLKKRGRSRTSTNKTKISSRIFRIGKRTLKGQVLSQYKILVNSGISLKRTSIRLNQHGDSGNVVSFELIDVKNASGKSIPFGRELNNNGDTSSFKIGSISIPCELNILVREPFKSSFRISN